MRGEVPADRRLRRAPHAWCAWEPSGRVVRAATRDVGVPASPLVIAILDRLDDWTSEAALASALDLPRASLQAVVDGLLAFDLVEVSEPGASRLDRSEPSPFDTWSPAARLFHLATRDVAFTRRVVPDAASAPTPPRPPAVLPSQGTVDFALPRPTVPGTLTDALAGRRTHRRFAPGDTTVDELGTLLGATFGVQAWAATEEGPLALKTSPSGGARHSLEAFVWVRAVAGVPAGLHHYRPDTHVLTRLEGPAPPSAVTEWLPAQDGYDGASVVVVLAAELARVAWRYRSARAYRVVLIEAGHLAQTFCLVATALGLGPFCTGALADSAIESALGLDAEHRPVVYAMGVGRPVPGAWQPHADRPAPRLTPTPHRLRAR